VKAAWKVAGAHVGLTQEPEKACPAQTTKKLSAANHCPRKEKGETRIPKGAAQLIEKKGGHSSCRRPLKGGPQNPPRGGGGEGLLINPGGGNQLG